MSVKCFKCDNALILEAGKDANRYENCTKCNASVRCCMMCQFYDTSSYNECREPTADRITDKEKANFCDFFKVSAGGNTYKDHKTEVLSAADALFKK